MASSQRNGGRRPANRTGSRTIAGPTSALTDYLAANNISAAQIARNAQARQQQALADELRTGRPAGRLETPRRSASGATPRSAAGNAASTTQPDNLPSGLANASSVAAMALNVNPAVYKKKLSKADAKAIDYYKTTDNFRKAKRHYKGDMEDDDTMARMFFFAAKKSIGQLEHCAQCEKRFTVTNYTRSSPDGGGLLCSSCSKELDAEEGPKKKKQKTSNGGRRRQTQSRILDGSAPDGVKSLVTLCIERLSRDIDLAEDLGVLPEHVMDRIARILSKRRKLNSKTLNLFLQPGTRVLKLYDAANLQSQDFIGIFQCLNDLTVFKCKYGIQFKNEVVDYLIDRPIELEELSLEGSNLITDPAWERYLSKKGSHLKKLRVSFTDMHFTNNTLATIAKHCPDLVTLKLKHNQKISADGFEHIKVLSKLEHLCLLLNNEIPNPIYVDLLDTIGPRLQTLSLKTVSQLNDTVLEAIHRNCQSLTKLRITDAGKLTDDAFARLFGGWNNPPLRVVELSKCRLANAGRTGQNPDKLGLCDAGFTALMEHSGRRVQHLNVESCQHISRSTFLDVFAADKTYPELVFLDVSFCDVDDLVVGSMFRCCPALHEIKVFGCMKVTKVPVPRHKVLIGVSNAIGMRTEGTA